jgi:hypothetical protein
MHAHGGRRRQFHTRCFRFVAMSWNVERLMTSRWVRRAASGTVNDLALSSRRWRCGVERLMTSRPSFDPHTFVDGTLSSAKVAVVLGASPYPQPSHMQNVERLMTSRFGCVERRVERLMTSRRRLEHGGWSVERLMTSRFVHLC